MIVCHCNVICSDRIRTAVTEALEELPTATITPATVYERCKRAPDCGGCQFAIRRIIRDMVAEREADQLPDEVQTVHAAIR